MDSGERFRVDASRNLYCFTRDLPPQYSLNSKPIWKALEVAWLVPQVCAICHHRAGRGITRCAFLLAIIAAISFSAQAGGLQAAPRTLRVRTSRAKARHRPAKLSINPDRVNDATLVDLVGPGSRGDAVLRAQLLLDRVKFSPGEINAVYSDNLRKAILAFQTARSLELNGKVDAQTWAALNADEAKPLIRYTITAREVAGPFTKIPRDMMEKAKLKAMSYESPLEELAEKFHASPGVMRLINPRKPFGKAGEEILAPNVSTPQPGKAASVLVDGSERSVTALDADGKVLAYYPATVGSEHDPLPVGTWKITGKRYDPKFYYNPDLFWNAPEKDSKATIAPGPRNPVGVVWIALSKEHYGIHGTPTPSLIGRTESHGCIRLTNWDAAELSRMVEPGVPAILMESKPSTGEPVSSSSH
ncbi:MAG TPA: L,D-transpeptidase [Terriglobia bacterium]|nr:L,D-transpeptidase [Terriglobia bacterium]